jgi:hypothetical protein
MAIHSEPYSAGIPTEYGVRHIGSTWPRSSCRPLYLYRGMPIPSDLSDFPLANTCGNGTYVFEISWMCVSRLKNCNISGVECGKIEIEGRVMAEDREPWAVSMLKNVGHLPRVDPGDRESAPRQSGVTPNWCNSTLDWFTEWLPGNLIIHSRDIMYMTEGIPHFPHREPTNAAVESDNCVETFCAFDNYYIQAMNLQCLSFHMSKHCRHQACSHFNGHSTTSTLMLYIIGNCKTNSITWHENTGLTSKIFHFLAKTMITFKSVEFHNITVTCKVKVISEWKYLKKFQYIAFKYLFLLGNDSYFEILGKKILVTRLIFVLCQKMYFVLKNSSIFGKLASSHLDLDGSIHGSINRKFSQLKLKFFSNGLKAKHVGQLPLCISPHATGHFNMHYRRKCLAVPCYFN